MNRYLTIKVREAGIWNAVLFEDKNGPTVHYDRSSGYPGLQYSILGTYRDGERYIDFIESLVINGTEYRTEKIRKHFAEVQVLLDQEHMEKLLEEIGDDQSSFEGI